MISISSCRQRTSIPGLIPVFIWLASLGWVQAQPLASPADAGNGQQVARGKFIYKRFCSLCHGAQLEGEKNWRRRKPNGKLPSPPHDETGHTWHHPDSVLFSITKYGMVPPNAPENYASDMPAWQGTLKDEDIWAVIAYIKSTWPDDIRRQQQEINRLSIINRE